MMNKVSKSIYLGVLLMTTASLYAGGWELLSDWESAFVDWTVVNTLTTAANPQVDADNPSAACGRYVTTSNKWDLIYVDLAEPADFDLHPLYRLKVLAPTVGSILFKFENAGNTQSVTRELYPIPGKWDELLFDFSDSPSGVFVRMVIFIDFLGTTSNHNWYLDDLYRNTTAGVDTLPPSAPTSLRVSWTEPTSLQLTWSPSIDDSRVTGYRVSMNSVFNRFTRIPTVDITGLNPQQQAQFQVVAVDPAGNLSAPAILSAQTTAVNTLAPPMLNFRVGTQSFGASYGFTNEDRLIETARAVRAMGSNIFKFSLAGEGTVAERISREPFRTVLDMDFTYYHLWVYGPSNWYDGQTAEEGEAEYRAIKDLAKALLLKYNGSGKSFYLGHWEGDWHLVNDPGHEYDTYRNPLPAARVDGMIDWLNARQDAIEDARRELPDSDVQIYQYTEVNLVKKSLSGYPSLTTEVLPTTRVDYVSYSSYDAIGFTRYQDVFSSLQQMIRFIESHLPAKDGINGNRIWIGEYGYPYGRSGGASSPQDQDARSRNVMRAALELGCPFVLYWEMYNNEVVNGVQNGFWMINDRGEKQPVYYTHRDYYAAARSSWANFVTIHERPPDETESRRLFLDALEGKTAVLNREEKQPSAFSLSAYPNPFNLETRFQIELPHDGRLQIEVIDLLGRRIHQLVDQHTIAGSFSVTWDGRNQGGDLCAAGLYFVAARLDHIETVVKVILLK